MTASLYDIPVRRIDGTPGSLGDFKGSVLLVVNVASACGLTPQYAGLEQVYEKYRGKGLQVLGFPANDFGAQEPGTDAQVEQFCTTKYGAKFDMFSKVAVKGDKTAPLFDWLQNPETNPKFGGAIKWNFNKFLVDKSGNVIGRFEPKVEPTAPEVRQAIEAALAR